MHIEIQWWKNNRRDMQNYIQVCICDILHYYNASYQRNAQLYFKVEFGACWDILRSFLVYFYFMQSIHGRQCIRLRFWQVMDNYDYDQFDFLRSAQRLLKRANDFLPLLNFESSRIRLKLTNKLLKEPDKWIRGHRNRIIVDFSSSKTFFSSLYTKFNP